MVGEKFNKCIFNEIREFLVMYKYIILGISV